jgi:sec-independent protein translocase protein TatA
VLAVDVEWGLPIIALLVLVLFGGSQLPKLARGLGSAQREFKKGLAGDGDDKDEKPASEKRKSD